MSGTGELRVIPIRVEGDVKPGDAVLNKLLTAMKAQRLRLARGDIVVITHKIISKAEGALVPLVHVRPSRKAQRWARKYSLDPRVVHLALSEARRIVRMRRGVLITETRHGFVCANSGVDLSNVDGGRSAAVLPRDPDRTAASLHSAIKKQLRISVPVIIADTFGRPWREGLTEVAIGVAGMHVFRDDRGRRDAHGYSLRVTVEAVVDELACAAGLVCGKLSGTPAAIIRGFKYGVGRGRAKQLIRPAEHDLFR